MSRHTTLTAAAFSNLRTGWREGARRIHGRDWGKLLLGLLIAFAMAIACVYVLTTVARGYVDDGLQDWDRRTLLWFNGDWQPFGFTDGVIFESPANLFILIPVTLVAAGLALRGRRPMLAVVLIANYVLARPLIWFGWQLWDRQRPQIIKDGAAALAAHSFPSGHAILCVSGYGLLCWLALTYSRSWIERAFLLVVFAVFCVFVSGSRLLLGAHWPSDVIAGVIVGLVWVIGVIGALRFSEPKPIQPG